MSNYLQLLKNCRVESPVWISLCILNASGYGLNYPTKMGNIRNPPVIQDNKITVPLLYIKDFSVRKVDIFESFLDHIRVEYGIDLKR